MWSESPPGARVPALLLPHPAAAADVAEPVSGRDAVSAFVQQVPDAELSAEIRRRFPDSGLTLA